MQRVVAGILERGGRLLICQRRAEDTFPLKGEFPGGKLHPGESPDEALRRELREELGIEATPSAIVDRFRYRYSTGEEFELIFLAVREFRPQPRNLGFADIRWVATRELARYDFLEADRHLVLRLAQRG